MNRLNLLSATSMLLVLCVLTGCAGAPRTTIVGVDEKTSILLVGHLLGGTVMLSNGFSRTIGKDDLQKSVTDIYSVKSSPDQLLDHVLLDVNPGDLEIVFTSSGGQQAKRRIFVTPGITNQVRFD